MNTTTEAILAQYVIEKDGDVFTAKDVNGQYLQQPVFDWIREIREVQGL